VRFSWVQYTAFNISCNSFEPFAIVVGHIVLPSVQHPQSWRLSDGVEVLLLLELLFLGALHKLPDVLRDFFAFFFGVAHCPVSSFQMAEQTATRCSGSGKSRFVTTALIQRCMNW